MSEPDNGDSGTTTTGLNELSRAREKCAENASDYYYDDSSNYQPYSDDDEDGLSSEDEG